MKNILLLGNGFDLYYKLPTKYADFLHIVAFLQDHRQESFKTIGDVFSQPKLQEADKSIEICYEAYHQTYDSTPLDQGAIAEIISLTENNLWFSYLKKVFDKDAGWIDFEKEIGYALKCFEKTFEKEMIFQFQPNENHIRYVVSLFGFFIKRMAANRITGPGMYTVSSDYLIEKPIGSDVYEINTEKVVDKLYQELSIFAKALRIYLKCFVESTYDLLKQEKTFNRIECFSYMSRAITFNYTHTYESLYFNNIVFHIHGNTNDEIVLGVNPDKADDLASIDTTFVCFKKYYQRTFFETDKDYLAWMSESVDAQMPYRLFTMGHSLDITDKDIILELFENAKEIKILYHNAEAKSSYIANIINIFGKSGFDMLKKEKKLTFVSLDNDLAAIQASLSQESWQDLAQEFCDDGDMVVV